MTGGIAMRRILIRAAVALISLLICALTAAGCLAPAATTLNSGIEGICMIGPVNPVEKPGETNEKPYADAVIVIFDAEGVREVTRFEVNEDGTFRFKLQPGTYVVKPENGSGSSLLPYASPTEITVSEGQYTKMTVNFDSGIR